MDSPEVALSLAVQSPNTFAIHLRATRAGFAPENILIVEGIKELKSSFVAYCLSL